MVLDFGKNRARHHQDQAKCDYYNARQVTIHPIVMYYCSTTVKDLTVHDAMIFVSDDLKHDHYAVICFLKEALLYVKNVSPNIKHVIIYSDGCSSQCKGKSTMAALSLITDVKIDWNFYGSDHGRGEADGELGTLNQSLDKAILGHKVIISNAEDITTWCNKSENLHLEEPGSKRHFHLIKHIDRSITESNVKPLVGIRSMHQIKNVGTPYCLESRHLSCYCKSCRGDIKLQSYVNKQYVGDYKRQTLTLVKSVEEDDDRFQVSILDVYDDINIEIPVNLDDETSGNY